MDAGGRLVFLIDGASDPVAVVGDRRAPYRLWPGADHQHAHNEHV